MNKTTNGFALAGMLGLVAVAPATLFACGGGKPAESPAASAASSSSAVASGSSEAAPTAPSSSASAAPAASAAAAPEVAPLGAVLITDGSVVQKLFDGASSSAAATAKAGGVAGADPLAKGVRELAKQQATGMEADGPLQTGTLKEKQHLHADVTLKPGKCYALVGFSTTVKDLDVHLLLPPGILSAQDTTDDNKPVVGKAPDALCPRGTTAITYKVDFFADQGAGDIAVQLYSKAAK